MAGGHLLLLLVVVTRGSSRAKASGQGHVTPPYPTPGEGEEEGEAGAWVEKVGGWVIYSRGEASQSPGRAPGVTPGCGSLRGVSGGIVVLLTSSARFWERPGGWSGSEDRSGWWWRFLRGF